MHRSAGDGPLPRSAPTPGGAKPPTYTAVQPHSARPRSSSVGAGALSPRAPATANGALPPTSGYYASRPNGLSVPTSARTFGRSSMTPAMPTRTSATPTLGRSAVVQRAPLAQNSPRYVPIRAEAPSHPDPPPPRADGAARVEAPPPYAQNPDKPPERIHVTSAKRPSSAGVAERPTAAVRTPASQPTPAAPVARKTNAPAAGAGQQAPVHRPVGLGSALAPTAQRSLTPQTYIRPRQFASPPQGAPTPSPRPSSATATLRVPNSCPAPGNSPRLSLVSGAGSPRLSLAKPSTPVTRVTSSPGQGPSSPAYQSSPRTISPATPPPHRSVTFAPQMATTPPPPVFPIPNVASPNRPTAATLLAKPRPPSPTKPRHSSPSTQPNSPNTPSPPHTPPHTSPPRNPSSPVHPPPCQSPTRQSSPPTRQPSPPVRRPSPPAALSVHTTTAALSSPASQQPVQLTPQPYPHPNPNCSPRGPTKPSASVPVQAPSQSPKRLGLSRETPSSSEAQWRLPPVWGSELERVAQDLIELLDDKWMATDATDTKNLGIAWEAAELDRLLLWVEQLCFGVKEILRSQEYPLLRLRSPICVLGDLHGRFDDLHFFIQKMYNAAPTTPSLARTRSNRARDFRIANNFLLLGQDGEHEVAEIHDVPDALSGSSSNLSAFRKQASVFVYSGRDSLSTSELLFLGDFVDRGFASLEVILYVLALKVLAPTKVHLLRGNHETDDVNDSYGFKQQCQKLFGSANGRRMWWMVNRVFDDFPLAAILDGKMFCAHGGIPRLGPGGVDDRIALLEQTERWREFRDSPNQADALLDPQFKRFAQIFEDLLWADPADECFEEELDCQGFGESLRGISVMYGTKAIDDFLRNNELSLIMRAHQMKSCGFNVSKNGKVITVFSSSHYAAEEDNFAGVALVTPGTVRAITRMDA